MRRGFCTLVLFISMVAHIGLKLSTHTYYITSMTLNWFPWQPPTTQPQAVFFKITTSLLKLANYGAHGDETLCTCVFHCFHDNRQQKCPQALFPITTSSLLKLANHAMHGSETWYAYVFQHFHDNHEQKMPSGTFSCNYFFTSQTCTPYNVWR